MKSSVKSKPNFDLEQLPRIICKKAQLFSLVICNSPFNQKFLLAGAQFNTRDFVVLLKAYKACQNEDKLYRFHALMHTFATLLLASGEELKNVQELLGHKKISTTADIYAEVLEETKRKVVTKLDAFLRCEAQLH